jgi:hypothetical protein
VNRILGSGSARPSEVREPRGGGRWVGSGPDAGLAGVVPPQDMAVGHQTHGEPGGDGDKGIPIAGGDVDAIDALPGEIPSEGASNDGEGSPAGARQSGARERRVLGWPVQLSAGSGCS